MAIHFPLARGLGIAMMSDVDARGGHEGETTMATYQITSSAGVDMGSYVARGAEGAIEAMHRDAGYSSSEQAATALGTTVDAMRADLTVREVPATECVFATDEAIEALRTESGEAGDLAQVAICDRALAGDERARVECERVIRDARAMAD